MLRRMRLIAIIGMLAVSGSIFAETSYHRLKRKLHKVERNVGSAAKQVGRATLDILSNIEIEFGEPDEERSDLQMGVIIPRHHAPRNANPIPSPATPAAPQRAPAATKPAPPGHPARLLLR